MKTSIAICEKVQFSGFDPMLNCQGAIGTLGYSLTQALEHFKSDYPGYILYLPLALVSFLPIYFTSWYESHRSLVKQVVFATIPLFLIAWDYGRWISIIVTQLTILILMESFFKKSHTHLSRINLPYRLKLLLLFSCCFWGLGHGGNPLTNGWIGFFPSLGSFLIS